MADEELKSNTAGTEPPFEQEASKHDEETSSSSGVGLNDYNANKILKESVGIYGEINKRVDAGIEKYMSSDRFKQKVKNHTEGLLSGVEEKLEKRIDNSRTRVIETLGIFVALFTFISVQFGILNNVSEFTSALGFSLVLLGGLTFFILLLHHFVSERISWQVWVIMVFLILFLVVGGSYFVVFGTT